MMGDSVIGYTQTVIAPKVKPYGLKTSGPRVPSRCLDESGNMRSMADDAYAIKARSGGFAGVESNTVSPMYRKAAINNSLSALERRILEILTIGQVTKSSIVQAGIGTKQEVDAAMGRLADLNLAVAERIAGNIMVWKIRPTNYMSGKLGR